MRRFVLPLLLCSAVGAVIVILVLANREERSETPKEEPREEAVERPGETSPTPLLQTRTTPTKLSEHKYLSELERVLGRDDLSHARWFRQKICEDMNTILESPRLTNNLLASIRKYAIGTDDAVRREVLLPILRSMKTPEATALLTAAYFESTREGERLSLIESMLQEHHDPKAAAVWAADRTLSAEKREDRERAIRIVYEFAKDREILFRVARTVYQATTDPKQSSQMLAMISESGSWSDNAQAFIRDKLKNPRPDEILPLASNIEGWGTHKDAENLEGLAVKFPSLASELRERALAIRRFIRVHSGEEPDPTDPEPEERERLEAEAKKLAEAGGKKDGE